MVLYSPLFQLPSSFEVDYDQYLIGNLVEVCLSQAVSLNISERQVSGCRNSLCSGLCWFVLLCYFSCQWCWCVDLKVYVSLPSNFLPAALCLPNFCHTQYLYIMCFPFAAGSMPGCLAEQCAASDHCDSASFSASARPGQFRCAQYRTPSNWRDSVLSLTASPTAYVIHIHSSGIQFDCTRGSC